MKRKITLFIAVLICVLLCGCNGYTELNNRYVITALGVDFNGEVTVSAEIFISGDTIKTDLKRTVVRTSAENISKAFYKLKSALSKNPFLDHCTAVVIGESVDEKVLKETFEFCKNQQSINLGIDFVLCENAEVLLKNENYNTAIGFDIASSIDSFKNNNGIDFNCKHLKIESDLSNPQKIYTLPYLETDAGGVNIHSAAIFNEFKIIKKLTKEDMILYSVLCNKNSGDTGIFLYSEYADLSYCRTVLDIKEKGDTVHLNLKTKISKKKSSENFDNALIFGINNLIKGSENDIFGFLNRIEQKDLKLYKKVKENYKNLYQSGKIKINYTVENI